MRARREPLGARVARLERLLRRAYPILAAAEEPVAYDTVDFIDVDEVERVVSGARDDARRMIDEDRCLVAEVAEALGEMSR